MTLPLAFFVSLFACMALIRFGGMLDRPNARSLHATPVPRTGGIAIAAGMLPAMLPVFIAGNPEVRLLIAGWLLVFGISLLDDVRDLPAWLRLAVHAAAGLLVVLAPGYPDDLAAILAGLFWIVWGTNLFNFMDGMDGLAGSMALIGGAALGLALHLAGDWQLALPVAAAAAAVAGFLPFNLPAARIFMGDAGSAPLGFLFAATAVSGTGGGFLPAWLPMVIFLPFIADATFTLLRRALAREPFWRAHRTHAYQRAVLSGWPVRRVLAVEAAAMLLCGSAVLLPPTNDATGWTLVLGAGVMAVPIYCAIMRVHRGKGN